MCQRIGLIRHGRLAAVRKLDELRAAAPRRVTVVFSQPVNGLAPPLAGAVLVAREPQRWVIDVSGPLGPLVSSLSGLPVHDVAMAPFALEDVVLALYGDAPQC
jgi:uncharacterized membrane protein